MKAKGFTLVEILIVVVILGILAAIVIPQFTEASTEARTSSLMSNLQTVRAQLELYAVQHNDDNPPAAADDGSWPEMTGTTDIDGDTTGTDFGPYLQQIPPNPFTNSRTVVAWGAGAADGSHGWEYNATTGEFRAAPDTTAETDDHQAL
jgi:general secretion pathway protein G